VSLPRSVRLREVGPRDGFQNEPELIPADDKVRLIDALARTGVPRLELTSFVRADVVPQLADAGEVIDRVDIPPGVQRSVLVPNLRGLETALEHRDRFDAVSAFLSASETHNRRNVNRSVAESLDGVRVMQRRALDAGLRCQAVISTSFGCPYEGEVPEERVLELARALAGAGAVEIGFGDTTGMANPVQVERFFTRAREELGGEVELTAHFHNTRGQGLANAVAALRAGCESFESSFGELGGCPVPAGATGNIATEDLVCMLEEMGVATGVDLMRLLEVVRDVAGVLGRPLGSHTLLAGPVEWHPAA
jgi:hydroxymethylglutaryl-CoA lyase